MDALRKAEQQKQQGAAPEAAEVHVAPAAEPMRLEPLAGPAAAPQANGTSLPELPKRLEDLDDQFFTSDPALKRSIRVLTDPKPRESPTASSQPKPDTQAAREAAQNVFAAKQPAQTVGHGFAITVSVTTLIAIAAIGGYFYWQMQPKGGLAAGPAMAQNPVLPPVQPAPAPVIQPQPMSTAMPVPAPVSAAPQRPVPGEMPRKTADTAPPSAMAPLPAPAQTPALQDTPIRLSTKPQKTDGSLDTAHAAFTRGETDLARAIWLKTLQGDARNINALHGLAALALQENKFDQAAALYRRILEVDPKDAVAHANLLSMDVPEDARQAESRLKGLLAEQPDSPHLHFALGNLYMNDKRWADAQQAFFKAHTADPANPDYLYNLAVSLDHLRQAPLAVQFYTRALAAARSQAVAFDPARVEERLKTLQNEHQR